MMYRAYSFFDWKALTYSPPFFQPTDGAAMRLVEDVANDLNTQIGRHPSDFVLYCVGQYDDQKGAFTPFAPLTHVVDVVALVRRQEPLFADLGGDIKELGRAPRVADLTEATASSVQKLREEVSKR